MKSTASFRTLLLLVFVLALQAPREARAVRPVDATLLANDCLTDRGVAAGATSPEEEEVRFDSVTTPASVRVSCPRDFEAVERTHETDGGTCEFLPAPGNAGKIVAPATHPSALDFSCRKNLPEDCAATGGTCTATAKVTCRAIPVAASAKDTELCRNPGLYGQISAVSTGLIARETWLRAMRSLEELQSPVALPTSAPPPAALPQIRGAVPAGKPSSFQSQSSATPGGATAGDGEDSPVPRTLDFSVSSGASKAKAKAKNSSRKPKSSVPAATARP